MSQLDRDARYARRRAETEQRISLAGELRQQALQEVLVHRQVDRPDAAPAVRPRRRATTERTVEV